MAKDWNLSGGHFEVDKKIERLQEISLLESQAGFWENQEKVARVQKEKSLIKNLMSGYEHSQEIYEEFEILDEYALSDDDTETASDAIKLVEKI